MANNNLKKTPMEEFMLNKIVLYSLLLFTASFSKLLYSEVNWSEPSTLASFKGLENQQIAFNDAGQGIAVWSETDGDKLITQIFYATCEASKWSRPEVLASAPSFFGYSVAINNSGKAAIVWNTLSGGPIPTFCLIQARLFDGRSWGKVKELHNSSWGGEFITVPKVVLSESNEAIVSWSTTLGDDNYKLIALTLTDQAWSKPTTLSTDLNRAQKFDIAINQNGQGIVAWLNSSNAVDVKIYDRSTWSPTAKTISSPNVLPYTNIIASYANLPHPGVIWAAQYGQEEAKCEFSWLLDSGNWMVPASLGPFGGQGLYRFDLAVNTHGEGLAAWGGPSGMLKVNHFYPETPAIISTLSSNFNSNTGSVKVSINEKGNGAAIWNEGTDTLKGNVSIRSEWLPEPHTFSNALEESTIGQIAIDQANTVTALWINAKSANGENALQTAFGKGAANRFLSYGLNPRVIPCNQGNSVKVEWNPSSDPKVKRYALYRNGALIAKFSASETAHYDHLHEGIINYRIDLLDQNNQVLATSNTTLD